MDLGLVMGAMCHHSTSSNGNGEVRFCAHCYLHLHAAFLFSTDSYPIAIRPWETEYGFAKLIYHYPLILFQGVVRESTHMTAVHCLVFTGMFAMEISWR